MNLLARTILYKALSCSEFDFGNAQQPRTRSQKLYTSEGIPRISGCAVMPSRDLCARVHACALRRISIYNNTVYNH